MTYIWRFAPELKFLQFPWRWSLVLSIVFALSLGAAATMRSTRPAEAKFRFHAAAILIAAIAAVSLGTRLFWQPCDEEDVVSAQVAVFQAGTGFEGTDEYTPIGADNSLIQQNLPQIRVLNAADAETAPKPGYRRSRTTQPTHQRRKTKSPPTSKSSNGFPNTNPSPSQPKHPASPSFASWITPPGKSASDGASVRNRPHRDDGLMTIPVPAGTSRIDINYAATPDVWWGRGLSVASLLTLLTLALAGQKRREVV